MSPLLFDAMFVAAWLVLAAIVFFLANLRWRYTALPRAKLVWVCVGFAAAAFICAQISLFVFIVVAIEFCTPPNCF